MQLGLPLGLDLIEPFEVHVEKPAAEPRARSSSPPTVAPGDCSAQAVGEAPWHRGVLALLVERHHDQLAAGAILHADVDERRPLEVADEPGAALARLHAPGGDRAVHARDDLRACVERAAHALAVAIDGVIGDRYERHSR